MDTAETGMTFAGARDAEAIDSSAVAASSREMGLIQAQFTMAMQRPRKEEESFARVLSSCERSSFAIKAIYMFPRGGQNIEGPSVNLAREGARCWGNIQSGYRVVDINAQFFRVQGFAMDMETNNLKIVEIAQRNLIYRKKASKEYGQATGWLAPNERDAREMQAKAGAIAERNAILQIIPKDAIDEWMNACKRTMSAAVGDNIEKDRTKYLRNTVVAWRTWMVTQEMLEGWLGSPLAQMTRDQAVELQGMYRAIEDGQATRDDFFSVPDPAPAAASALDAVVAANKKKKGKKKNKSKKGPKTTTKERSDETPPSKEDPPKLRPAPARAPERASKTAEERLQEVAAASQAEEDSKFEELDAKQKSEQAKLLE